MNLSSYVETTKGRAWLGRYCRVATPEQLGMLSNQLRMGRSFRSFRIEQGAYRLFLGLYVVFLIVAATRLFG
jgi:hypothetical protein